MPRGRKPKDAGRTFASLYETFINLKQAEGCRERTIKDYRDTLRDFARFFDLQNLGVDRGKKLVLLLQLGELFDLVVCGQTLLVLLPCVPAFL